MCAVKQPVRGLSQDEMAGAEAIGRDGEIDLEAWTRASASSECQGRSARCGIPTLDSSQEPIEGLGSIQDHRPPTPLNGAGRSIYNQP